MNLTVSDSTKKLIESLYREEKFWQKIPGPDAKLKIIQDIGKAGEPAAIPDLLPMFISGSKELARACAKSIHQLMGKLAPADFARFDELIRLSYAYWLGYRERWYHIRPQDVAYFAGQDETAVSLLGIASSHWNGFVRERAIDELAKINDGRELPFLLLRANDWVPQVRTAAKTALLSRLRPDYGRHLFAWVLLLTRLRRTRRQNQSEIIQGVERLFETEEMRPLLQEGLDSPDRFVQRFCFERAWNGHGLDFSAVVRTGLSQADSYIRLMAVKRLAEILPNDSVKGLLIQARNDRFMPVRREALRIYAEKYSNSANQELERALFDRSVSVRQEAQYFLKRTGRDLRALYSEALNESGAEVRWAILGLGETGLPEDAELLERFLSGPSMKLRAAAVHAIAKLDVQNAFVESFLQALADRDKKIAREGWFALSKRVNAVGAARLWGIYKRCGSTVGKRGTLFLLARTNKWDSICFMIQALEDQDDFFVDLSRRYISRWFARYNRTFTRPTTEQISNIRNGLNKYGLLLSGETKRALESVLGAFATQS
jgi:HEAT repeat protein